MRNTEKKHLLNKWWNSQNENNKQLENFVEKSRICILIRRKIYLLLSDCWQLLLKLNSQNVQWLQSVVCINITSGSECKHQNVSPFQTLKHWTEAFRKALRKTSFRELLHVSNRIKTQERRISFSNEFSSGVSVRKTVVGTKVEESESSNDIVIV